MTLFARALAEGMNTRARWVAMAFLVASFVPASAMAQDDQSQPATEEAEPPSEAEARMLSLNEEGFSAFSKGSFIEAAKKFEEAHTYVPDPILRKNAAIAWFKAQRCKEASEAAVFFLLADEMSVRDRVEARSVLGHCRLERAEAAIEHGRFERAQAIVERVAFLETDERVEARLAGVRMQLVEARAGGPVADSSISSQKMAGWALVAGGAALIAGNIGYHLVSDSKQAQLDALGERNGTARQRRELQDHVDTADWLVPTLYGVGGVSLGTGVWLTLTADSSADSPKGGSNKGAQETEEPAARKAPAPAMQLNFSWKF